jgi:peptidoglycan/xylan/chitin deacetylase (PgdA/CDA1 family)
MSNILNTVFAILILGGMALAIYTNHISFQLVVLGIATVYLIIIAWGSANIRANFFLKSTSHLPKGKLAITFDDGPSEQTEEFLDYLKSKNVPATFFVIGKNIAGNEDVLKRIVSEGHTIGNHSYAHDYMFASRGKNRVQKDMTLCSELIEQTTGKKPLLFRPPFGVTTPTLAKAIKKMGVQSIGWTIRTHDGVQQDSGIIERNLFKKELSGAIVLFHDTNLNSLEVLDKLITRTAELGIEIVSLQEELKAYA